MARKSFIFDPLEFVVCSTTSFITKSISMFSSQVTTDKAVSISVEGEPYGSMYFKNMASCKDNSIMPPSLRPGFLFLVTSLCRKEFSNIIFMSLDFHVVLSLGKRFRMVLLVCVTISCKTIKLFDFDAIPTYQL